WSLGERLLEVPGAWAADPAGVPLTTDPDARFLRSWYPRLAGGAGPGAVRSLARHLPGPVRRPLRRAVRAFRRPGAPAPARPPGYQELDWQPAAWYGPWWPRMRAFALPSFYDGRVRVNLRGRERDGLVAVADYDRVCDEIEALVRGCTDPRTGVSVVKQVERCAAGTDPRRLDTSSADLVVEWNDCTAAFDHPAYGIVGPLPFRRTGGHTGPFGFAFVTGNGFGAGDHGVASSFDVAATMASLLSDEPVDGISGSPLTAARTG
ncbi:MAG TPA: hypothetical protein VFC99_05895, partial [Acidimicrobiia bacterium]|nr:hypothetical protein [Acidimicrobiia bacterium]